MDVLIDETEHALVALRPKPLTDESAGLIDFRHARWRPRFSPSAGI